MIRPAIALYGLFLLSSISVWALELEQAEQIAEQYIETRIADDMTIELERSFQSAHNGVSHLYYHQNLRGQTIADHPICLHMDAMGKVIQAHGLIEQLPALPARRGQIMPAKMARQIAGNHLGIELPDDHPITQKVYFDSSQQIVTKVWNTNIETADGAHWWDLYIDVYTGEIVEKKDWVHRCQVRTWALPSASPDHGPRPLFTPTINSNASPFGWHDDDGITGPEFLDTRGNNVWAQEDRDANNFLGYRPHGGTNLVFDFGFNPQQSPVENQDAAITHAFYANNIAHDLFYQYGFTEAAGNFQENNYGRGGLGSDPVFADVQDASSFNNATFSAVPDGTAGRMQLHLWQGFFLSVEINTPASLAGLYTGSGATFGNAFPTDGLTGTLVAAFDPPDPPLNSTTDGCSAITNSADLAGNIAFIDRGECFFIEKVKNAQNAGAIAVMVANHLSNQLVTMSGTDETITIPSVFVSKSDGDAIRAQLDAGTPIDLTITSTPQRDGSLDSGIILHEYGHGVSTRLTGGAANPNCLSGLQSGAMGEGWSDWWGLVFTQTTNETRTTARGIGTYVTGQSTGGTGIRTLPYSTALATNPLTYGDLTSRSGPHAIGEIWCATLWDMYWDLTDRYGYDADLYNGSGGNNLALQLVMDGLMLQPCNPTFLDARNAILFADRVNNEGNNQCLIWRCFARRGMGANAQDGGSHNSNAITENFAAPLGCANDVSIRLMPRAFRIDWMTEVGASYQVQKSPSLIAPTWTPVGSVVTAQQPRTEFTLPGLGESNQHYRVQLLLDP